MVHPVCVETNVGDTYKPAKRLMKALTFDDLLHGRTAILRAQVGVERRLPHGHEEDHVTLLASVLLRDLQLDCLTCMLQCSKEGRDRLAHLKVDGSVLNLNHHIWFEGSIERVEVIVSSAGAI